METTIPSWLLFERSVDTDTVATPAEDIRAEKDAGRLYCKSCRHYITDEYQRIEMNRAHEHRFTNPHGITFHIGCYRIAPGCIETGPPTMEWTWFSGYAWQIALCGGCQHHLGWLFSQTGGGCFYALIPGHLVRQAPSA